MTPRRVPTATASLCPVPLTVSCRRSPSQHPIPRPALTPSPSHLTPFVPQVGSARHMVRVVNISTGKATRGGAGRLFIPRDTNGKLSQVDFIKAALFIKVQFS